MQPDPRTVARDIPGILDEVFPQLTSSNVAHINGHIAPVPVGPLSQELLSNSKLQGAMLFELAYTVGERFLQGAIEIDWDSCFSETLNRQRAYFNAKPPVSLEPTDKAIAEIVGRNLANTLSAMSHERDEPLIIRPFIPGLEWVSSGTGDFALGRTLIEVKCTAKSFSSADLRQVAMYWLLSYAASIEGRGNEWKDFVLLNPRIGAKLTISFDSLISVIGGERTKVEILLMFQALIDSRLRQ